MWVETILTRDDLEKMVNDFCPLTIRLGENGNILLSDPRALELVPSVGLRMSLTVEVHWPVLGIQVPVSVRSVTLEVKPEILKKATGDCLTFKLRIDDVDTSLLPEILDRGIVDRVNKELEEKHVDLSWAFIETLSHVFELPGAMTSARAIDLHAQSGSLRITNEALVLATSFEARVEPRGMDPCPARAKLTHSTSPLVSDVAPRALARAGVRSLRRSSPMSLALVGGSAMLAGITLWALLFSRRPRSFA
jgi:hypothetical protein